MRAMLFEAVGSPLAVVQLPDPTPGEGEVVVRVSRCGVCGTDLHATSGHGRTLAPNSQLGHEYAGEVVALGKGVEGLTLGARIAALPIVGCGQCDACQTGIDVLCSNWKAYGAGLAEYARVSERGATRLPDTVSLADGALVEPLAVGARGVRLADPRPDDKVLIIGPGPIGLAVLFWLRMRGVENIALLASSGRRQTLASRMGGDRFVVEGESATEGVTQYLGGAPDIVFEAAGTPGVLARALGFIRPQGKIIALGFCMKPDPIVPAVALMKDATIRFSVVYTRADFEACANALDSDGELARAMVTETVGIDAAPAAFEALRDGTGSSGKLLIDPWG